MIDERVPFAFETAVLKYQEETKSLAKTECRNFRWILLVLACKGFPLPFRIYCNAMRMLNNIKARLKRKREVM